MSARYLRRAPVDVLEVDGESLVLIDEVRVVRLSPIATTIYALATSPLPLPALAAAVESRFGPPPHGSTAAAVSSVLSDLRAAGLVDEVADD